LNPTSNNCRVSIEKNVLTHNAMLKRPQDIVGLGEGEPTLLNKEILSTVVVVVVVEKATTATIL
jgi:hypothetical protein